MTDDIDVRVTFENVKALLEEKIKELKCREKGFRKSRRQIMQIVWRVVKQAEKEHGYEITNEEFGELVDLAWDRYEGVPEVCKT
jgi:isopropylmalate/homocitrate/citramalate synthase